MTYYEKTILIIGGGLAGLTAALDLRQAGYAVTVLEKGELPRHKVCGEYISNEVLPYLQRLGVDPFAFGATRMERMELSTEQGKRVSSPLPLGGFGISRHCLDGQLKTQLLQAGGLVIQDEVRRIERAGEVFTLTTQSGETHQATVVIGAYGKRSRLDKQLDRAFIQQRAPYLGVKAHYAGDFPEDLVALHNFRGGYCGVSKVEDGRINICYLADYAAFKEHKNLADFEQQVVRQNPHLAAILDRVTPLFDQPLTISQVSFANKTLVEDGVLLAGDAAGMIHPLCGNGMGMAIGAAGLLVPLVTDFLQDRSTRQQLEQRYQQQWRSQFRRRLLAGRLFNVAFQRDYLLAWAIAGLVRFPSLLPAIIRQTHA